MSESATPLQWPANVPRTKSRQPSRKFQVTFAIARSAMLDELEKLGGENFVLSSNQAIRPDGLPYADTRAISDPGVAVYFTRGKDRLCIACDTYDSVAGNIRGIGLTVGALRAIDRHGSPHMVASALVGFKALPSNAGADSNDAWWVVLGCNHDSSTEQVKIAYRKAASAAHPDCGGSQEAMVRVNDAMNRSGHSRTA